jgi:hypothetical protein
MAPDNRVNPDEAEAQRRFARLTQDLQIERGLPPPPTSRLEKTDWADPWIEGLNLNPEFLTSSREMLRETLWRCLRWKEADKLSPFVHPTVAQAAGLYDEL